MNIYIYIYMCVSLSLYIYIDRQIDRQIFGTPKSSAPGCPQQGESKQRDQPQSHSRCTDCYYYYYYYSYYYDYHYYYQQQYYSYSFSYYFYYYYYYYYQQQYQDAFQSLKQLPAVSVRKQLRRRRHMGRQALRSQNRVRRLVSFRLQGNCWHRRMFFSADVVRPIHRVRVWKFAGSTRTNF